MRGEGFVHFAFGTPRKAMLKWKEVGQSTDMFMDAVARQMRVACSSLAAERDGHSTFAGLQRVVCIPSSDTIDHVERKLDVIHAPHSGRLDRTVPGVAIVQGLATASRTAWASRIRAGIG